VIWPIMDLKINYTTSLT